MSVDPSADRLEELREEVADALIAQCRLSEENIARIRQQMRTSHSSFSDAALRSGIVTQNELRAAMEWVRLTSRRDSSVVETAIRRHVKSRDVFLRHARQGTPSNNLLLVHDPDGPRSERLRALRTELLLVSEGVGRGGALALLSPCAGEGRSQLAAELAIAFSQLDRRTLLIDADLRHPRQHLLFGAENNWGLAQALAFNESPQLLGVDGFPHLSVLTAGPSAPNPLELLSGGRFERHMQEWRGRYESIIIDTPPVSSYADALAIATLAGSVLVLSRAESTAQKAMREMLRRLGSTQCKILGAVISNF